MKKGPGYGRGLSFVWYHPAMDTLPGGMIDISGLPLQELWKVDDSALSHVLRQITDPDDEGDAHPEISAFNSGL